MSSGYSVHSSCVVNDVTQFALFTRSTTYAGHVKVVLKLSECQRIRFENIRAIQKFKLTRIQCCWIVHICQDIPLRTMWLLCDVRMQEMHLSLSIFGANKRHANVWPVQNYFRLKSKKSYIYERDFRFPIKNKHRPSIFENGDDALCFSLVFFFFFLIRISINNTLKNNRTTRWQRFKNRVRF